MASGDRTGNFDQQVIDDFGAEWETFTQSELDDAERTDEFQNYFAIFPWNALPESSVGADFGCGSGRWAGLVAPTVGHLHCVDPSNAIDVARNNLRSHRNITFHRARLDDMEVDDRSLDFAYVLGVLHHLPEPETGLAHCVRKLKPGAPILIYVYYRFDNQPAWYRHVWRLSNLFRRWISKRPSRSKVIITQIIAALIYYPLARFSLLLDRVGIDTKSVPLSHYRAKSFYTMRTDALDRFGTRLEHRFTKAEIEQMMRASGLNGIRFNSSPPFWCAVGYRADAEQDDDHG